MLRPVRNEDLRADSKPCSQCTVHLLAAPAGVPQPVLDRVHAATVKALGQKDIADPMIAQGALIRPMTPTEFADFIRQERDKWGPVVKASGAKME